MGTTHFKSSIVAKNGTETISGFASVGGTVIAGTTVDATGAITGGSTIAGTTEVSGATVAASNYVKICTNKYIFQGGDETQASLMAIIEALVATPLDKKGSLYFGDTIAWRLITNNAATKI